jgi:hypothetical protein
MKARYLTTGRLEAIAYCLDVAVRTGCMGNEYSRKELETARAWAEEALAARKDGKRASPRGLVDRPRQLGWHTGSGISPTGGAFTLDMGPETTT